MHDQAAALMQFIDSSLSSQRKSPHNLTTLDRLAVAGILFSRMSMKDCGWNL